MKAITHENELTHINDQGRAKMVSVEDKAHTHRVAVARGTVQMAEATFQHLVGGHNKKGDVLAVAQVAGIMAAKRTSDIIPMCHPLLLTGVDIHFTLAPPSNVHIEATVKTTGQTGVEMEALTAVSATALTIYDMLKAVDKDMIITDIRLMEKQGGKSGHYIREERP